MDKIYKRINWDTETCNGNAEPNRYLHSQIARAICLAAYEKPVTVEEISGATGIPTMYIEDELPRLEYGDAIKKNGNKYATDFIIFSLENNCRLENVSFRAHLRGRAGRFARGSFWLAGAARTGGRERKRAGNSGTSGPEGLARSFHGMTKSSSISFLRFKVNG